MSNGDTFIDLGLDDAQELKSVPAGEYQVRVVEATIGHSEKTGGDYLKLRLELPGETLSKDLNHFMMFPTPQDDPKKANNRKLAIRNAIQACGIDSSKGFNPQDLVGCTAWAILREEEDPEYGKQNSVKKWVAGK